MNTKPYRKIGDYQYVIPQEYKKGMRVPALIIASNKLIENMEQEVFEQITNVACLPGLVGYAMCMPDGHVGYGCPIGGVFASKKKDGIISPGAVGFDINCGMRLITTSLFEKDVRPRIEQLVELLFANIPAGVGGHGFLKLNKREFNNLVIDGAAWAVENGLGRADDLASIEENGKIIGADPEVISKRAVERGQFQIGTLGSGNHYLEVQVVDEIFDTITAKNHGIEKVGQVVVMFHCGSRGFGHQVATDYLNTFEKNMEKYQIEVPDPQLASAPFESYHGQSYYKAMAGACNLAFANRQVITHRIREVFSKVFGVADEDLGLDVVYDVSHNIAKVEKYKVNGKEEVLVVHRKGATRSFPNQPVILGGSMETGSYFLVGTDKAMETTFGSTAHGSGRTMSRHKAKGMVDGRELLANMKKAGIFVRSASYSGLAEEAGFAYKNIHDVVKTVDGFGISKKVAYFRPIGNIKG